MTVSGLAKVGGASSVGIVASESGLAGGVGRSVSCVAVGGGGAGRQVCCFVAAENGGWWRLRELGSTTSLASGWSCGGPFFV